MKIAIVCPSFYPNIGGVETVVFQLASNMTAKGNEITILTQTKNSKLARKEKVNNFTVLRFNEIGIGELKISFGLIRYLLKYSNKYDLLHAQNYHAFPALITAITKKKPLIISPHYHGTGHTFFTHLLHFPYRYLGRLIFSKSDAVICDTDAEARLLTRHFPHTGNISIVPLGIDLERIHKAKKYIYKSPYILSVGRLENYKNVDIIIRSLQHMNSKINLIIVGDGPKLKYLKDLSYNLNLSNRILFLKNITNDELFSLLKGAEAYVTMSSMEAYGLTLLESVAAMTGIVASDIPAHKELVNKFRIKNIKLLAPNSSSEDLSKYIKLAMINPSYSEEKLSSWDLVTKETFQVYKKVCSS